MGLWGPSEISTELPRRVSPTLIGSLARFCCFGGGGGGRLQLFDRSCRVASRFVYEVMVCVRVRAL